MQDNTRFEKLKPIFLNKANYTFDLQNDLDAFVSSHVSVIEDSLYRDLTTDLKYLMKDDISVETKLQFEKQFTEIIANPQKAVILFNYYPLGQWVYLSEINDNSFTFYAIHFPPQEGSNDAVTGMYRFNALFEEKEIVFCMMKNLCKVCDSQKMFEQKFNEYRNLFDGSIEDFLDCLINAEDYKFHLNNYWEEVKKFPRYEILRAKLTKKLDSLFSEQPEAPAPPATGQPTNTKESETALTNDQEIIYKHIEHLKRINLNREKIMSDENFKQLFNDLCYLVENDAVPEIKKPLSTIGVTNQSIIYTLRLIHVELFGKDKIRQSFIEFLQKYFHQLRNMENMRVAFSKKPPKKYPI